MVLPVFTGVKIFYPLLIIFCAVAPVQKSLEPNHQLL